jgi:hypothetical protein
MATGRYFASLDYRTFIKLGTNASAIPTTSTGMTRILSLDNTSIQGTSESTTVLDYDSELGFASKLVTSQDYNLSCSMNLDVSDDGYRQLKIAGLQSAGGVLLQWYRETPVKDGSGSNPEVHAGLAFVGDFSEDIQAGNVAKVTFTLSGTGKYSFYPQGKPVATLTVISGGSGLNAATYTGVALVPLSPAPGIGSGKGATADIVVASTGSVTAAPTIVSGGTNFRVGDTVTVALTDIGGAGADVAPVFAVAAVTA